MIKELSSDGKSVSGDSVHSRMKSFNSLDGLGDNLVDDDDDETLSNGYHSEDNESCVMTSGNSPYISKEARYSFLSRSGKKEFIFLRKFI